MFGRFFCTGHECDGVGHWVILWVDHTKPFSKPMHVDAIGNLEHVWHVVADQDDQDDRNATRAYIKDEFQNAAGLLDSERRGWLVQDDHF